jgi:hypothetical protein
VTDKFELLIEVDDPGQGIVHINYDIPTAQMSLHPGPTARITIKQPLMPDGFFIMPQGDFLQILVKLAEHFFTVTKL